ncbi:zinc-ribbon domain containing protein [Paenibacillus oleatilyticus]|uniref:Zinc-ribbon domain containing protein n=1 Tax=Paenibacillus oleatilyticus TaxID=2594886 RepID=A0ABV4UXF1_9BACL
MEEQKFYKSKGLTPPKRCPKCREKKWFRSMGIELPDDDLEEES